MLSLLRGQKNTVRRLMVILSVLLMLSGCKRDLSLYAPSNSSGSSTSSGTGDLQDDEELPPEEDEGGDNPYEDPDSDLEWYSYNGVGLDKISWTGDGEHVAVVYHQLVQLVNQDNEPDGEIPFPEGYNEEYAVGERGVLFYGKQTPREKAYPSKCLWQTQGGKLFVAGIAIMEYDGQVVKEIPAVEVRRQEGQADTYWFEGVRVFPVETYEESWKWVDSKTLLLTAVQDAPDDPNFTCKFYYRYYPNTDRVSLIVSGNDFVTVHTNRHGIFHDSYHTTNQWGKILMADETGTRVILDGYTFSTYAVSDDIIAMLRWSKDGDSSLWYAGMDDLDTPKKITGIDSYVKNLGRWGSLDETFGVYIPLGGDDFYDVSTGEVVEILPDQKMDKVNPQGTHWIQHDDDQEVYRVVPIY